MSEYTLEGTLGVLPITPRTVDGWDYGQTAVRVAIISDGTSQRNEVLQEGNEPPLDATFSGQFYDYADVLVMREYYRTKEIVTLTDPIEGEIHRCYVFEFTASRSTPSPEIWMWKAVFVETDASVVGSGSGS